MLDLRNHLMTQEKELLEMLDKIWNTYDRMPKNHPDDRMTFKKAVYDAQNIILARFAARELLRRD